MADTLNVSLIIRGIDRASAPVRKITRNFEAMRTSMTRASKAFKVGADLRQAAEGMSRFARVARGAVAAPIAEFTSFQAAMSGVQAVSRLEVGPELTALTEKAKELGATTQFTATQAAEGLKFLGMAGFDTAQQLAAIEPSMNLATAAGADLGRTTDILSDVTGAFGLKAEKAGDVADVLAVTMTSSNTTIETLFETMKLAGPVATDLGISLSDVAAMAGIMGNAGIKGSMAGTALRATMQRLIKPVGKAKDILKELGIQTVDAGDNLLPLTDILEQVRTKTANFGTQKKGAIVSELFGVRALSGVSNIIRGLETGRLEELAKATANAKGAAQDMADTMLNNLGGSFTILKSAASGFLTTVGEQLAPMIRSLTDWLTGVVQGMTAWAKKHPTLTKVIAITTAAIAAMATALTGILFTLGALASAFGVLTISIGGHKTAVQLLSAAYKRLTVTQGGWQVVSARSGAMMMTQRKGLIALSLGALKSAASFVALKVSALAAAVGVTAATWPILAIVAAIAAVTAAVVFAVIHWDKIVGVWERFKNASLATKIALGLVLAPIVALLSPIIALAGIIKNMDPILATFRSHWELVTAPVKEFVGWLDKAKMPDWLRDFGEAHLNILKSVGGAIAETAKESAFVLGGGEAGAVTQGTSDFLARTEGASNLTETNIKLELPPGFQVTQTETKGKANIDVESAFNGPLPVGAD